MSRHRNNRAQFNRADLQPPLLYLFHTVRVLIGFSLVLAVAAVFAVFFAGYEWSVFWTILGYTLLAVTILNVITGTANPEQE